MDYTQRPTKIFRLSLFVACSIAAYCCLAVLATAIIVYLYPLAQIYDRAELKTGNFTKNATPNVVYDASNELEKDSSGLIDFNEHLSPLVREYILTLKKHDKESAKALLKDMSQLDLGYAATERNDYPMALHLWLPLAKMGISEAEARVAELYDQGATGVSQNEVLARDWYRRCAARGELVCQLRLAHFYVDGRGGAKDQSAACVWFSVYLMAALVEPHKNWPTASVHDDRYNLSLKMDPAELLKAKQLASRCYSSSYKYCGSDSQDILKLESLR